MRLHFVLYRNGRHKRAAESRKNLGTHTSQKQTGLKDEMGEGAVKRECCYVSAAHELRAHASVFCHDAL